MDTELSIRTKPYLEDGYAPTMNLFVLKRFLTLSIKKLESISRRFPWESQQTVAGHLEYTIDLKTYSQRNRESINTSSNFNCCVHVNLMRSHTLIHKEGCTLKTIVIDLTKTLKMSKTTTRSAICKNTLRNLVLPLLWSGKECRNSGTKLSISIETAWEK